MEGAKAQDIRMAEATAIVLAGGKSSRMGRPKALLTFDSEPLIAHIVRTLQHLFGEIVVVAAPGQELPSLPVTLVRDDIAYQGPVGGIYYGLKAADGEFSFVTSCDVAFLNSQLISYLLSQISEYDVVVPYWEERFQPLHAVYRRSVLPLLEGQLERGELRPVYLFDRVRTAKIGAEEIRRFDPEGLSFFNMNTAEDYAQALQRWAEFNRSLQPEQNDPVQCSVELFGVARLISKTREISLSLPQGANLAQVFSVLADKLPALVGRVISPDKCSLSRGYACNVNGRDFVRNPAAKVTSGDKIFILSADAGG
jgi:molybdenum cofactor guanylyltransferase